MIFYAPDILFGGWHKTLMTCDIWKRSPRPSLLMSVFITLALVILKLALAIFVSQETLSAVLFAGWSCCQAWSFFSSLCSRRGSENCHRRERETRSVPLRVPGGPQTARLSLVHERRMTGRSSNTNVVDTSRMTREGREKTWRRSGMLSGMTQIGGFDKGWSALIQFNSIVGLFVDHALESVRMI